MGVKKKPDGRYEAILRPTLHTTQHLGFFATVIEAAMAYASEYVRLFKQHPPPPKMPDATESKISERISSEKIYKNEARPADISDLKKLPSTDVLTNTSNDADVHVGMYFGQLGNTENDGDELKANTCTV